MSAPSLELRPASHPVWGFLLAAVLAAATGFCTFVGVEVHKIRLDVEASWGRQEATTAAIRTLTHAVAPKADHYVCAAHDGHPEVDLGEPSPCPDPADGQCVKGMPLSAAQSRCAAGKL